jgi:hypothetical protein
MSGTEMPRVRKKQCIVVTDNPTFHTTGDSRYTRFHYPRFRISAVLFQCYEEYLSYPRLNFKVYYLRRNFSQLIRESDAYVNLGIKEFWHQLNIKMAIMFPVLRVFVTRGDSQECNPRV